MARKLAIHRYFGDIDSGRIVACEKMRKVARRVLSDLKAKGGRWHFDPEAATAPVEFIERFLKIPSGRLGQPFLLEDYEKAWIETIFGFVDDEGNRRYQEVLIVVARKNGKSSLVAALELYMLIADGEGAPQVYNLANNIDQAKLAYNACIRMLRQSGKLQRHVRKREDDIYCDINMGFIKPMASNTSTLDGLDVHMGVLDEIHAMKDRDIYDLVRQGMAARERPLLVQITTNGFVRNSIFDDQYEYASKWLDGKAGDVEGMDSDRFIAFIYELDSRDEWDDESCWVKSNPGLGTVKKAEFLRDSVAKAKMDPKYKATVMTKDFNMPENSAVAWLRFEEAVNERRYFNAPGLPVAEGLPSFRDLGFRYGICGFDASDTIDLTAASMLCMRRDDDTIYERNMFWIPEDVILADMESGSREERDSVPYQAWIASGLMRTVPGNKIDKSVLLDWLVELRDEEDLYTYAIGLDPWHIDDANLRSLESFVGSSRVFRVRQGPMTLSQPMKQLKSDLRKKRIVDNNNPIMAWNRLNVMVRADINDNIQPYKKGLSSRNRIDGFMAELDAYVVLMNNRDDYLRNC